jgi:hypothetical protein
LATVLGVLVVATAPAVAQYPGHTQKTDDKKPAPPRAISVLEWVGDQSKPKASRIVPVTVFVNGQYQDGGLYLARPAPLTVENGTAYEIQKAGIPQGFYDLNGGQNVGGTWFGFGDWRPLTAPKPPKKMPQSKYPPHVVQDNDADRPHFKGDAPTAGSTNGQSSGSQPSASKTPAPASSQSTDPNSPTLHKRTDDSSADSGSSSADDPDKPTLHRHADSSGETGSSGAGAAPDDPDRPHMKKHADTNTASTTATDTPSIGAANENDPDRPTLSRGKPALSGKDLTATQLSGLPSQLQQMVAVSDASTREEHPFAYQWPNPDDATKMKAAVEALAIKAVLPASEAPPPKTPPPAPTRPGAPRSTLAHRMPLKPPPVTLSDEDFRAYELSYGGGATLVLTATAHIGPTNAGVTTDKYVTIVAQPDFEGVPQVRLQSVTTQADLDITPQMRLVDAADTDGDNRAELVFELRHTSDRQFAIYRMHGTKAEQAFATESLPYGNPARVEIKVN